MTYSALDRFNDSLNGKPRDRVPLFPLISGWAATNFSDFPLSKMASDPELIVEAQIRAREFAGYDALWGYADPLYIPEAFGCGIRYLETGPLSDPLPLAVTSLEDVQALPEPDPRSAGKLPVILETVKRLQAYGGGDIPVLGLIEGPFSALTRIIEADVIMRMFYKNPTVLEALLDKISGFLLRLGQALTENGATVIFMPEPSASASMISPTMFRQYALPRLQDLIGQLNVPCILHICGDTSPTLESMGQTGAHILSLDQCMNLTEARRTVPQAVIGGNVNPIDSLLLGTREAVMDDTLNCLRTGGTCRFVLMSGCSVPPRTPVENVKAMVEAAKDYGLGPLT